MRSTGSAIASGGPVAATTVTTAAARRSVGMRFEKGVVARAHTRARTRTRRQHFCKHTPPPPLTTVSPEEVA
jgi:hypothetical protein